jgi:ornithine cyclodeaminase
MRTITVGPDEVRQQVSMGEAIAAVRDAFVALARGDFEMPTRTVLRDGQFLVMPTHHRPSATAVIKTLSLSFEGRQPSIAGTVTWSDLRHADHLVADAGAVTTLRTGAATGVATDLLAKPDASTCTIIGAGGQAADQVRAVQEVRPLADLCIVARHQERAERLATSLAEELAGVRITTGVDAVAASTVPLFPVEALAADVHVNAIGAFRPTMRELPVGLLADALVVVDETEAVLEESGEILDALAAGVITQDDLLELGRLLTDGVAPTGRDGRGGRTGRTGRTVFKSVGVAVQDWAVARLLADRLLT